MRKFLLFFAVGFSIIISSLLIITPMSASWWGTPSTDDIPYCRGSECSLSEGVDSVRSSLDGQITERPLSEYIQEYVQYLLTFISIIAVLFIIWSGFRIMTSNGDEETVKRSRISILYVVIGIIVMWLAYSVVSWILRTLNETAYHPSPIRFVFVESASAASYSESENDTFLEYKGRIQIAIQELEAEFRINKEINPSNIDRLKGLLQSLSERLPDRDRAMAEQNDSAKRWAETLLTIAANNPKSSSDLREAIRAVSTYINDAKIEAISGEINATPTEGNAPLSVSFRATNIKDPSGTIPPASNHIWWIRENGGIRRELGRGPSLMYTFGQEGTFTVFLDVVSASRNSKGRIDVLPLSTSKQIEVRPKLGEVILLINGVNVSNLQTLKIAPAVAAQGLLLDASASRAIGNGVITETSWNFGNNNTSTYKGAPVVERQVFATQGQYPLKLSFKTNDGQTFSKELLLDIRDPAAVIRMERTSFHVGETASFGVETFFNQGRNIEYIWEIQDENGTRIVRSPNGLSFSHTFERIGSYIVTLTARNPNGQVDTDSKVITVESRDPIAAMDNPKPIRDENPNTFIFDATKSYDPDTNSRQNLTYTWRLNGSLITLDDISHGGARGTLTFDSLGENTISVTVANAHGKIATAEQKFTVNSLLSVGLIITPQVTQGGGRVHFIARAPNADFFEWDMGDGSQRLSGNSRSVQHVYQKSGVYNVTLTVSRAGSNQTNKISGKVYITNKDEPMAIMNVSNMSNSIIEEPNICDGREAYTVNRSESTTFNANQSVNVDGNPGNLDYTWKYMGKVSTNPVITETFGDLGCYPIELTVRSKTTGATNTIVKYIELKNQPPELTSISANVDTTKKDSQKVLVKVNANGVTDKDGVVTSYMWYYTTESDPEPQNVQITQNPSITFVLPNITEKYYFGVILEDNDGARVNSMDRLQGQSPLLIDNANGNIYMPLISLSVPKTTVKAGEKVRFSATAKTIIGNDITNRAQYAWDFDGDGKIDERTSTPSVEHTYERAGDFTLRVRVTYNGVSNTKYQSIHVRNELKASADIYRLPNNQLYFLNTSQGVYDKTRWNIGEDSAYGLYSHIIDANTLDVSARKIGQISVSNNDSEIAQADLSLDNVIDISGEGSSIVYQSYPRADENNTITITDPSQGLKISLYGNTASAYAIDTDMNMDSNLDGITDNDIDNKESPSYTDGSLFVIPNFFDAVTRERDIKITLYDGTTPVSTKTIHLVFDFLPETTATQDDSITLGIEHLTQFEREKLEELAELIRSLNDGDRLIVMKKYNILVENWDIALEKAKALIDIQEYVTYSPSIDNGKKESIARTIDELLVGSANANNAIEIATQLIRDLIPDNSPNREALLERLDQIASHPESIEENRRLGTEMLEMVRNDATIEDKYKLYIRDQLLIITGTGDDVPVPNTDTQKGSGLSGILGTIVQIFFVIIGFIILTIVALFVYYRISRKEGDAGFQDFIIDRVFHGRKNNTAKNDTPSVTQQNITEKTSTSIEETLNTETIIDPLRSYTPPDPINTAILDQATEVAGSDVNEANVPDWLKTAGNSETNDTDNQSIATSNLSVSSEKEDITSGDDGTMPDWLKTQEEVISENESKIGEATQKDVDTSGALPDWLSPPPVSSNTPTQTLPGEEISTAGTGTPPEDIESAPSENQATTDIEIPATDDLPDWLRNMGQDSNMDSIESSEITSDEQKNSIESHDTAGVTELSIPEQSGSDNTSSSVESQQIRDDGTLPEWLRASLEAREENITVPSDTDEISESEATVSTKKKKRKATSKQKNPTQDSHEEKGQESTDKTSDTDDRHEPEPESKSMGDITPSSSDNPDLPAWLK